MSVFKEWFRKSLFNIKMCEKYVGEREGLLFLLPKQEQKGFK